MSLKLSFLTLFFLGVAGLQGMAHELSGNVAVEARLFANDPVFPEQERDNASLSVQPEYYHEWPGGSSVTVVPFARLDSADSRRTHFDIRELNFLWLSDAWELRVGLGKVFWGTTEFLHLVDIINQTDLVESIDGEDKLGQPMVKLSVPHDWGTVDVFVLPGFRERTFPGAKGRLRGALPVDTGAVRYENGDEEYHVDFAVRYSHTIGPVDMGLYHFHGTGREPTMLTAMNVSGEPVLIPFYEQIDQTGLDAQLVAGQWLWKLESIYRAGQGKAFFASVGGFEYTIVNIGGSGVDTGLIFEWAYDDRGTQAMTVFNNDAMFGIRIALNDAAGTEFLAGVAKDLDSSSLTASLEASRRFGNNWKISLEGYLFSPDSKDSLFYGFRDDDFIRVELAYYY